MSEPDSQTVLSIRLGSSLCYFLPTQNGAILIDSGNANRVDHLNSVLLAHEHELQEIRLIILTHTHHDHVGSLAELKLRTGASVMVHAAEADFLRHGQTPLPNGTTPYTKLAVQVGRTISYGRYEAVEPDILIDSETDLRGFGFSGRVLPTPGHTVGSMSILVGNKAFVGDTLFGIRSETVSPPFLSDIAELKKSWSALLLTDCLTYYPGHGKAIDRWRFENFMEKITHN